MDRVKREDVEKTINPQYSHGTGRNSAQVRVDDLAAHQTLLLLEIRDLLAEAAAPEPIHYVAEGQVEICDFPPGANVVRCTLEMLKAMKDTNLESIAESLAKLANPLLEVPKKPSRALRRRLRTDWICKLEGKATFKCVDCRRMVEVPEDSMRGLPGPWMPLKCRRCGREFELDGRHLDGDTGKMMRAFFPDEPDKAQAENSIRHERVFGGRNVFEDEEENP